MSTPSSGRYSIIHSQQGVVGSIVHPVDLFPSLCHATTRMDRIAERFEDLTQLLSLAELELLHRKKTRKRSVEFLGGRILAKLCVLALEDSLDGTGDEAQFFRSLSVLPGDDGEPLLQKDQSKSLAAVPQTPQTQTPRIHLSIAHDAEFIFCAADSGPVGVDVETVSRRFERVRTRIIRARNHRVVRGYLEHSDEDETAVLARVWAAAECMVKTSRLNLWHILEHAEITSITEETIHLKISPSTDDPADTVVQKIHEGHVFSYLRLSESDPQ